MPVDPYSPCPCGSGKKLKFCCADLAGDIEKVSKLVESEQPHAALKHVEKLLEKDPDRASLLDVRAMLELSLHELDAAEKTIAHFLNAHPQNPAALAQGAMLAATRGDTIFAVIQLQDALEETDQELPLRVFEAIGAVGHALLLEGDFVAARAHLLLYAGVAPEGDNRAIELLLRLNLQGGLPLLLRDNLLLHEAPEGYSHKAAFDEANRFARRGWWRRAEAEFAKLLDEASPQPEVAYNLALVRGWLADDGKFAEGLHRYAQLDVALDDAVEAEALAQLVDPEQNDPTLDAVRTTYPVLNEDAATERLLADSRVELYELDAESLEEDPVTRPRSTHILLDRAVPRSGAELLVADAPNVVAFLSLYGKRTDREARLEATTDRGEHLEHTGRLLGEILGDAIGPEESTEVIGQKSASEEALSWRWRLPDDTPPAHRRELLHQRRRHAILEDWTAAPRAALGGLPPRDAVGRQELRIPLLASVLIIEQAAVDARERGLFQELRQRLQLPAAATVDPDSVDWDRLPLIRVPRLDLSRSATDRLMQQFNRAAMAGASVATLALAEEIVARNSLDPEVAAVYRQLIRSEPDPDRALTWTAGAKQWAGRANLPAGEWALLELEVQIERGDPLGVQSTLNEIRAKHLEEPGIADATYRLLYAAGLLSPRAPQGGMAARNPLEVAPPAAEPNRLWVPGQEAPADPAGKKSAIWTP